ncbi:MAG: selenocysteine-specific translation elongation factor [Anaerolineaceae bacterium]|nr:selenocysteine-specific translation elongation factor [Anaerolineaceae bacterium]
MRVVGTAGHVDHGKSTLVAALTGTHPDRLKEERDREMTIELGFAWFSLPDGEEVGIVDVPGHRDFIENMLAGVGGIDAALFVVAADEGVMPQTREHLAILDILQVQGGVIALTKIDLVDDPEWLDLIELDIRTALAGTGLEKAPVVRVSARNGTGLEELKNALSACLSERPARPDLGRPRLPIDRVFTITGFGTIATGTLLDGQLTTGDEVEILPVGLRCRVRGLQTHKKKEKVAIPGSRTAVNLTGIEVEQVRRGDVLALPGKYRPSTRLDVYFRLLPDASSSIRHNLQAKFFLGAAEVKTRVRLLGTEELLPGQEGWLQLELEEPVTGVRGDRYILRRPSPGETLGGGMIVDASPARRHKRFSAEVISKLEALLVGSPADLIFETALTAGPAAISEIAAKVRLPETTVEAGLQELLEQEKLILLEKGEVSTHCGLLVIADPQLILLTRKAQQITAQYHQSFPLRVGLGKEELKSRLKLTSRIFNALFQKWLQNGDVLENDGLVSLSSHKIVFTPQQQKKAEELMQQFSLSPYSPPSIKECQTAVGEEMYHALVQLGQLTPVSSDVVFKSDDYRSLLEMVQEHFAQQETLTVVEMRDRLNTSRRYVLAFLEHLDALGVTERNGDYRMLLKPKNLPIC